MEKTTNRVEQLKNVILVVLLLSTVLLLSFFWGKVSFDQLGIPDKPIVQEVPQIYQVLRPNLIRLSFGAENYTLLTTENSDLWQSPSRADMVKEFRAFSQNPNIEVEEITLEKFQEIRQDWVSIWAQFEYDIPFSGFCREYSIEKHQNYEGIETFCMMGYSNDAGPETVFLYDKKNKRYYRLTAAADSQPTNFAGLIERVRQEGYTSYYPIGRKSPDPGTPSYLGIEIENDTLIPVEFRTNLAPLAYEQEVLPQQREKVKQLAADFFGENLDFVRTIVEENGTLIYMYGFGQNVFTAYPDGSFTYEEEQGKGNAAQGYFDSLRTALQYVADHGSWESLDGWRGKPALKRVEFDPKGYRFVFGMAIRGIPLYDKTDELITIDVMQGQVISYKRNFVHVEQEAMNTLDESTMKDAFSPLNLIAQNYQYIYEVSQKQNGVDQPQAKDENFNWVAEQITSVQPGYLKVVEEEGKGHLQPVWVVTLNDNKFYFDLMTAEPLDYALAKSI